MEWARRLVLVSVVRVAFVAIFFAAFGADVWLVRASVSDRPGLVLLGPAAFVAVGSSVVARERWAPGAGLVAAATSLSMTMAYWNDGFRFTFFSDAAVLPVLAGVLLAHRRRSVQAISAVVIVTALAVGARSPDWAVRSILTLSMFIALSLAGTAVAFVRLTERDRRIGVELALQAERLDLAREIHDVVGHHVTGMIVLAQGRRFVNGTGTGDRDEGLDETLRQIESAGHETMASVRRLVGGVRADGASVIHLSDVEGLVDSLRATHPLTRLDVDRTLRDSWVPPDLATTVHRIVREAVTNVRRHGDADGAMTCSLERSRGTIVLTMDNTMIDDPGRPGHGLVGMAERAALVGGTFEAGPVGRVWRLRATLPIDGTPSP